MKEELRLTEKDILILKEYHRACQDKKTADKIKTILLISQGFTYPEIEKILLPGERTFNRCKTLYREQGIEGPAADNYQGGGYKLSGEQINLLKMVNMEIYEVIYTSHPRQFSGILSGTWRIIPHRRISRNPHRSSRVQIPRPVAVKARLFVQFFRRKAGLPLMRLENR
jgi:hypothetical protein